MGSRIFNMSNTARMSNSGSLVRRSNSRIPVPVRLTQSNGKVRVQNRVSRTAITNANGDKKESVECSQMWTILENKALPEFETQVDTFFTRKARSGTSVCKYNSAPTNRLLSIMPAAKPASFRPSVLDYIYTIGILGAVLFAVLFLGLHSGTISRIYHLVWQHYSC